MAPRATTAFAVVGVQNFAGEYIEKVRTVEGAELSAVVAARDDDLPRARELRAEGIEVFHSYERLLRDAQTYVDIVGLPVSIPSHASMCIRAMEYGYDVLLEKPPTPTVDELDALRRTSARTGQFCSVGFQYVHSQSVRRLKRLLLEGVIGEITGLACKGFWPRTDEYYGRNSWAGTLVHEGDIVLDGPVNNAFAHFLQNMLFLAGDEMNEAARPVSVVAERYRANSQIRAADTACLHVTTETGVDLRFYVTHVTPRRRDPTIEITGTTGRAELDYSGDVTLWTDGKKITVDGGGDDAGLEVFRTAASYEQGRLDRLCATPDNTRPFVVTVNGSFESSGSAVPIPDSIVESVSTEDDDVRRVVEGLENRIDEAFEQRILLSETEAPWAESRKRVELTDYNHFSPFGR